MENPAAATADIKLTGDSIVTKPSFMSGKMAVGVVLVIIAGIVFFIWTMYKRMKRLESQSKESQKMNNEMTNLKYAVQETMNNVEGLRRRVVQPQQVLRKTRSASPVPVPVPPKAQKAVQFREPAEVPKPRKLTVEEVDDDDVEGVSEIIEVEEDSDYESESE